MKLSMSFILQALPQGVVIQDGQNVLIQDMHMVQPSRSLHDLGDGEVVIDSREVKPGSIFLALQGERTDGHNFLSQAVELGARVLIVEKSKTKFLQNISIQDRKKVFIISVRDTLQALIQMAKIWRARFNFEVVGITGSVGKTTTKEMVRSIMQAAQVNTFISHKNQNTLIGLCLNILRMTKKHTAAVFELGINEAGEMSVLADILRPTKALITGIAHCHTQLLGNIKNVCDEKRAIFSHFRPSDIGIINGDCPLLTQAFYGHPIVKFGLKLKNQVQARKIKVCELDDGTFVTQFGLKLYEHSSHVAVRSNHPGRVYNALGAAAVGYFLNVPFPAIVQGIESFTGCEGRFELMQLKANRGRMVNDCYNANPASMKAALLAFEQMNCVGQKIAVLGDMLELGEKKVYWHRQVGKSLSKALSIKHVILVGELAHEIERVAPITMNMIPVSSWREANIVLHSLLVGYDDSCVLVKASRGVHLDNVVSTFVID